MDNIILVIQKKKKKFPNSKDPVCEDYKNSLKKKKTKAKIMQQTTSLKRVQNTKTVQDIFYQHNTRQNYVFKFSYLAYGCV